MLSIQEEENNDDYSIHLDDNTIKQSKQKRKTQMDLGIDDLLDGDILNYLINENRNLIDSNGQQCKFNFKYLLSYVYLLTFFIKSIFTRYCCKSIKRFN